jgi:hypothetical protein
MVALAAHGAAVALVLLLVRQCVGFVLCRMAIQRGHDVSWKVTPASFALEIRVSRMQDESDSQESGERAKAIRLPSASSQDGRDLATKTKI